MALPSGYTRLDYIESSGTQYIDTGFKPNGNTQVDIKFKMVNQGTAQQSIFGARPGSSGRFTVFTGTNSAALQVDYGTESSLSSPDTAISGLSLNTMTELSMSNALVVNGTTVKTVSAVTFTSTYNLYLFANNNAGVVQLPSAMLLYSCKIYDNGTLVRDFIPCKNASGAIGLWDNVNSAFYANAGTGTFSTGTKHKTLIDGTGFEIKSGRVLIAGTGYDIKKGRTLIGGTGYDISFGTPVGELAVGSSVFMNVGGVRTEFIVVHQGNPDSDWYTSGGNGTWVLMKHVGEAISWFNDDDDSTFSGDFANTYLNIYANTSFLTSLDVGVQNIIQPVTLKYLCHTSLYSRHQSTTTCKILSPDVYDLGFFASSYPSLREHEILTYFKNASVAKHIATDGSSAQPYFTRDIVYASFTGATTLSCTYVTTSGTTNYLNTGRAYFRPLYVLPPEEALFDSDYNIIPT